MITNKVCNKCNGTSFSPSGGCRYCNNLAQKKYRESNYERTLNRVRTWAKNNPEKIRSKNVAYREMHKEKIKTERAERYAKTKDECRIKFAAYRIENKERLNANSLAWNKNNPESVRISNQNRRAKKAASVGKLSRGIEGKLFKLQKGKCPCCNKPLGDDYHLDHKMPLFLGGSHSDENMQLLRKICNLQKSSKHPIDFMQQRGFLL